MSGITQNLPIWGRSWAPGANLEQLLENLSWKACTCACADVLRTPLPTRQDQHSQMYRRRISRIRATAAGRKAAGPSCRALELARSIVSMATPAGAQLPSCCFIVRPYKPPTTNTETGSSRLGFGQTSVPPRSNAAKHRRVHVVSCANYLAAHRHQHCVRHKFCTTQGVHVNIGGERDRRASKANYAQRDRQPEQNTFRNVFLVPASLSSHKRWNRDARRLAWRMRRSRPTNTQDAHARLRLQASARALRTPNFVGADVFDPVPKPENPALPETALFLGRRCVCF